MCSRLQSWQNPCNMEHHHRHVTLRKELISISTSIVRPHETQDDWNQINRIGSEFRITALIEWTSFAHSIHPYMRIWYVYISRTMPYPSLANKQSRLVWRGRQRRRRGGTMAAAVVHDRERQPITGIGNQINHASVFSFDIRISLSLRTFVAFTFCSMRARASSSCTNCMPHRLADSINTNFGRRYDYMYTVYHSTRAHVLWIVGGFVCGFGVINNQANATRSMQCAEWAV